jgi:chromosome segregation ATPase
MSDILTKLAALTSADESKQCEGIALALRGFGIPKDFEWMAVNAIMNRIVRPREAALIALLQEAAAEIEALRRKTGNLEWAIGQKDKQLLEFSDEVNARGHQLAQKDAEIERLQKPLRLIRVGGEQWSKDVAEQALDPQPVEK